MSLSAFESDFSDILLDPHLLKARCGRPLLIDHKFPEIAALIQKCLKTIPHIKFPELLHRIQNEFAHSQVPNEATLRRYFNAKSTQRLPALEAEIS